MQRYDRRVVSAPKWMETFQCIAGDCPETCCQQWNIDVDPVHAESYTHLGDPELQEEMAHLLYKFRLRRPGMRDAKLQYRLMLLNCPEERCPILNEKGECRLQKKYGAGILCDTCYFHPRNFFQIDEQIFLSACLSCPECARLALLHREPTEFSRFESEIDPGAEWLETSFITDSKARILMRNRERVVSMMCLLLQDRTGPFDKRMAQTLDFLRILTGENLQDPESIRAAAKKAQNSGHSYDILQDSLKLMDCWTAVFDPVNENAEKASREISDITRHIAGGRIGYTQRLAGNYEEGKRLIDPFLSENEHLIENFMVHCVFSDSFKQFHRCQNELLTPENILSHESALLQVWYILLHVRLAYAALNHGTMNEELFLQTVIHADRTFWHYPDWFARTADRFRDYTQKS